MYYDAAMPTSILRDECSVDDAAFDSELDALTHINVEDLLSGIGLRRPTLRRALVGMLCRGPARRFARRALAYDRHVGRHGLFASAPAGLEAFGARVSVLHGERIPLSGPLLITANHPGLTDALTVFAAVPRNDLRVVAASRPFLQAMPNLSAHLFYVDDERPGGRRNLIRQAADHLRRGGALLTFPAGAIEPDPALRDIDVTTAFADWSASIDLLVRLAPQTQVLPALISGVLSNRAQSSVLARLCREPRHREWLSASLQLAFRRYGPVQARIEFAEPFRVDATPAADRAATGRVIAGMRCLLTGMRQQ
jgi:hypothetical protein